RGRRLNDGLSNSLHAAGTLFRGDDLQHFDGRALVAVDDARAPVGDARLVEIKPRHHHWAGNHSEVSRRLDAAQDLVVYENPAQWRLPEQDFLADGLRAIAKVDPRDAKLDDLAALVQREQDLAGIEIAKQPALQNAHVHAVAVIRFLRDGHVALVDEQFVVWLRNRVPPDVFEGGYVGGGREEGEEGPRVRSGAPGW